VSPPQGLYEQFGGRRVREILLPGDQIAIANGERTPQPRLHEVCADAFHLVFDPPGHDVLVPRKNVQLPHCLISKVFLNVRESRDRFARCEMVAVGQSSIFEDGHSMA
jgi:hypothetical protein